MWSVGINGTLINFIVPPAPKGYGFSTTGIGLIYFAPITAIILGEIVGHFVRIFTCLLGDIWLTLPGQRCYPKALHPAQQRSVRAGSPSLGHLSRCRPHAALTLPARLCPQRSVALVPGCFLLGHVHLYLHDHHSGYQFLCPGLLPG